MKINKIHNQLLDTNAYKAKEDKNKNVNLKNNNSVSIEISSSAKEIARKIDTSEDSGFSDRVESIRKSILDGNYKVSSEDIAEKILQAINEEKGSDI